MKKVKINETPEAEMIGKVRGLINHLYPGIEEEMREVFVHDNEYAMKIIRRRVDFRLAFHAWFLLKHEFIIGATAMEIANSYPMNLFSKNEKKMIKNFLNYKESLFEITKISKNNKDYTIKDLSDNKTYLVKTKDLPARFSENEIIKAIIIKNFGEDYFFYGAVQSFDITNKKKFIKEMLKVIKIENKIRKEREKGEIEWLIEK